MIDVEVVGSGTIYSLILKSEEAKEWVNEYVDAPGYMWSGDSVLNVEHRYVTDIVGGMMEYGLVIE